MCKLNRLCFFSLISFAAFVANASSPLSANDGDPLAVRYWPGQAVTIETMWDFNIGLNLSEQVQLSLQRPLDLNVVSTEDDVPHILDRKPNAEQYQWQPAEDVKEPSSNAVGISVVSLQPGGAASDGAASDVRPSFVTLISVDGLRIADASKLSVALLARRLKPDSAAARDLKSVDVLLIGDSTASEKDLVSIAASLSPKMIVLPADFEPTKIGEHAITAIDHNTLAVSASASGSPTRWVKLATTPWKMEGDLAALFERKDVACQDSIETFAPLSAALMSFEPSNGTHTPRWNAEHMMGRELLFFSQIYHALNDSIPVMDLNPKQMPDEYEAAHPSWTGAEEARQMKRVEHFTRRFAYLLAGVDLDKRAPGSRIWTPRALLQQMERHYGEHTANVRKKMLLPEWPQN